MSLEFLMTSMVVILLPGTGVLYTLACGLGRGLLASIHAAIGCTLGIIPAMLAAIVGLAALLHTSSIAFQAVRLLGVVYLFYMAWGVLKQDGVLQVTDRTHGRSAIRIIRDGFFLNILNPKLSLFFLAFLPQFIDQQAGGVSQQMLLLGGIFMLLTLLVFVGYGFCASLAREYVISRPAVMLWLRRLFAGSFAALGLRLAMAER